VPVVTNIAYLRKQVDPLDYLPTDTNTLFMVDGTVTTYTNLTTTSNALFYIQDATAGIAVYVTNGNTVRPQAGDRLQVIGPLSHFNGLLELSLAATNAAHRVVSLGTNNLPIPQEFLFRSTTM